MKALWGKVMNLFNEEALIFFKGSLVFLIGPLDLKLAYLGVAMLVDLMFGMRVASAEKRFSWWILISQVRRKVFIYGGWIMLFNALDAVLGLDQLARTTMIFLLITTEVFSVSNNTSKLGYGRLANAIERIYFSLSQGTNMADVVKEVKPELETPQEAPVEEPGDGEKTIERQGDEP